MVPVDRSLSSSLPMDSIATRRKLAASTSPNLRPLPPKARGSDRSNVYVGRNHVSGTIHAEAIERLQRKRIPDRSRLGSWVSSRLLRSFVSRLSTKKSNGSSSPSVRGNPGRFSVRCEKLLWCRPMGRHPSWLPPQACLGGCSTHRSPFLLTKRKQRFRKVRLFFKRLCNVHPF